MLGTHDPKFNQIIVNNIPITGYVDGTFIELTRPNNMFDETEGSDGSFSRSKTNSTAMDCSINLQHTSPSNDILDAIRLADEYSNAGVVTFAFMDLLSKTKVMSAKCYIKKMPDIVRGKVISEVKWDIKVINPSASVGGSIPIN